MNILKLMNVYGVVEFDPVTSLAPFQYSIIFLKDSEKTENRALKFLFYTVRENFSSRFDLFEVLQKCSRIS